MAKLDNEGEIDHWFEREFYRRLDKALQDLEKRIREIERIGNPTETLTKHDTRISNLEQSFWRMAGICIGATVIIEAGIRIFAAFLKR